MRAGVGAARLGVAAAGGGKGMASACGRSHHCHPPRAWRSLAITLTLPAEPLHPTCCELDFEYREPLLCLRCARLKLCKGCCVHA